MHFLRLSLVLRDQFEEKKGHRDIFETLSLSGSIAKKIAIHFYLVGLSLSFFITSLSLSDYLHFYLSFHFLFITESLQNNFSVGQSTCQKCFSFPYVLNSHIFFSPSISLLHFSFNVCFVPFKNILLLDSHN